MGACQGRLYRCRVRLTRHSHGGTLKHKGPTPIGVRPCVGHSDVLVLAGCGAVLPPPPRCESQKAGAEEEERGGFGDGGDITVTHGPRRTKVSVKAYVLCAHMGEEDPCNY